MILYSSIILISASLIAVLNAIFRPGGEKWYYYILMTLIAVIASLLIDGITAFIGRRLPKKWMNPNKRIFIASPSRLKFYEKIGVKKWKDKVPELGGFTSFHKDKLANPWDLEYVERYLLEACYGVVIHYASFFTAYLIILLDVKMYYSQSWIWLTIMLPVAIINSILIVLPAFILRYNIPKLKMLYDINKKNREKKEQENLNA